MTVYAAEFTYWSDVTNDTDVDDAYDVFAWRPGGTPTGTGTALDAGSWANTGEDPLSESNSATYNAGTNKGFAEFDSTGGGPAADASTPSGTYVAGTWWQWSERGNGGGSTLNFLYGNSSHTTSTIQSTAASLGSSPAQNWVTSDSTSIMPTSSQDAACGMEQSGARDYIIHDQYFCLAVEQRDI